MFNVTLNLFDAEVQDIVNVLGNMPTNSQAFPLFIKINSQLEAAKQANANPEVPVEIPAEITVEAPQSTEGTPS